MAGVIVLIAAAYKSFAGSLGWSKNTGDLRFGAVSRVYVGAGKVRLPVRSAQSVQLAGGRSGYLCAVALRTLMRQPGSAPISFSRPRTLSRQRPKLLISDMQDY